MYHSLVRIVVLHNVVVPDECVMLPIYIYMNIALA